MDFAEAVKSEPKGDSSVKAWKDIWGCGQGIGGVNAVDSVSDVVDAMEREYLDAIDALGQKSALLK